MDTKTKELWLAALRSGEYRQNTDGNLHKDGSYCCLGVLCKITGAEMGTKREVEIIDYYDDSIYTRTAKCSAYFSPIVFTEDEEFSESLLDHFGMTREVATVLMELNDGHIDHSNGKAILPKSFPEIADYIENQGDKI
jgi:hypothetical protein